MAPHQRRPTIVVIHTKSSGQRRVRLRSGRLVNLYLPANSPVLLDSETGRLLIQ